MLTFSARTQQTDPSPATQGEKIYPTSSPVDRPFVQWSVRDATKKLGTGSPTWSRDGEHTGSPGVQEIEQKTSGITLAQDGDVRMLDAGPAEATRSPRNGRKRTGDSAIEGAGFPVQNRESHAAQSPKRTRAQASKRFEAGRGNIAGNFISPDFQS